MAIDDNSWDAGYEAGIRDQKKVSDVMIRELNQQIAVLQGLLASRSNLSVGGGGSREILALTQPQFYL